MRIKNTIRNSTYSLISFCFTAGLTIILRKVFLNALSVDFLGYEGLFGSFFSILSLSNLGISSLILYRLFSAFAKMDNEQISHLMSIYRFLYRRIGCFILLLGLALLPFLHLIIKQDNIDWTYVYIIYLIQLAGMLCTYFFAYKRMVFQVNQQEYICTKIDTIVGIADNLIRILVLLLLKSYIFYLICGISATFLSNILISCKVDRSFTEIHCNKKVTWQDVKALKLFGEIGHTFVQEICFVIYGSTDNILISSLFGIEQTGLLANYALIQSHVTNVLTKLLQPFHMSIGNYIYSENAADGERLFRMFDFISYWIACIVCVCYTVLFNPTITFFFGGKYLLPFSFVFAFAANQYIAWNHQFLTYYRQSFGKYELDTVPIVIAAVLNIFVSIVLGKMIGITGIMIGTAIGHLGIWFGRARVVYHEYMQESISKYILRQAIRLGCCVLQIYLACLICGNIPVNLFGIILRIVICVVIPVVIVGLVFFRTQEMKDCFDYVKKSKAEILHWKR